MIKSHCKRSYIQNDQVTLQKKLHSKWSSHIAKGVTFKMIKSHYKRSYIQNDQVTLQKELHSKWSSNITKGVTFNCMKYSEAR